MTNQTHCHWPVQYLLQASQSVVLCIQAQKILHGTTTFQAEYSVPVWVAWWYFELECPKVNLHLWLLHLQVNVEYARQLDGFLTHPTYSADQLDCQLLVIWFLQ